MRRRLVVVLLLFAAPFSNVVGRILPLTAKDVCLMLRSGYSSETVQRELSVRRFSGACDATVEKTLRESGAAPALVDAIKGGSYAISPADLKAAQEELAAQTARRARETEQLRKFDTLYQDQLARARVFAPSKNETPNVLADQLKGDLVSRQNGRLARFDEEALAKKKLIALYFSAHWCTPCRKFTPRLVEFYNRVVPLHPEFEIVFFSKDRSPSDMETYMRTTQMPWPAIDFAKLSSKEALKKLGGGGIPCLVVLDASGKVILDTHAGKEYVGPEKVLVGLDAIFAKTSAAAIAAER